MDITTDIKTNLVTSSFRIGGMTCVHCQERIEKALCCTAGVANAAVNYNTGTASVTYDDSSISFNEIKAVIKKLDYKLLDKKEQTPVTEIIGTLVIILSLYVLLKGLGLSNITSAFPLAESGMGYGMLLVIGLVTSMHCAAMCGGLSVISGLGVKEQGLGIRALDENMLPNADGAVRAGMPSKIRYPLTLIPSSLVPPILYNAGRVISYTVVGVIVGALGSVITISGRLQGAVQLAAGVFMVIMGINMLGVFQGSLGTILRRLNLRMPKIFAKKIDEQKMSGKSPLAIGLLNGIMPCGPLQAMQLYALSTGSPFAGGVSMFLFSMGTVPLMFGIGTLSSLLSGAKGRVFARRAVKAGAVLVTVMGMTMFSYGAGLSGLSFDFEKPVAANDGAAFIPVIENGVQVINSNLSPGLYPAITVRQGIPVRWIINAPQGSINGCNNRMIIREYGIEHSFTKGDNVITFMPDRVGRFTYSCWMGMIRSSITVVEEGADTANIADAENIKPAGVSIPTDKLELAKIVPASGEARYQTVTVNLRDEGIEPAIIVVRRGLPVQWIINNDSLDAGNNIINFPAYYTRLDMEQGDNVIQLMPTNDFDFSTGDNVFYGFVKVVDDLNNVDIESVKSEAGNIETMIYPDSYFESAAAHGGCCGT